MMRTIKFRAWLLDPAKEGPMIYSGNDLGVFFEYQSADPDHILMQFTGLKDFDGKEIYEQDLIQDKDGNKMRVAWQNGAFRCSTGKRKMSNIKSRLYAQKIFQGEYKVIGNRYENPEYLEEKNQKKERKPRVRRVTPKD